MRRARHGRPVERTPAADPRKGYPTTSSSRGLGGDATRHAADKRAARVRIRASTTRISRARPFPSRSFRSAPRCVSTSFFICWAGARPVRGAGLILDQREEGLGPSLKGLTVCRARVHATGRDESVKHIRSLLDPLSARPLPSRRARASLVPALPGPRIRSRESRSERRSRVVSNHDLRGRIRVAPGPRALPRAPPLGS